MLRCRLSMLLLCCLPALLQAADVERPSCASSSATLEPFAPVTGQALSHAQADALRRLFRSLDGQWRGSVVEQVCMVSGATQTRDYTAALKLVAGSGQLQLSGQYVQANSGVMRRFTRKLLLTGDGLRVDQPSRAGEVELGHADATGLDYVQRYRTVHKLPADPNAPAAGPASPLAAVLSLVAGGEAASEDAAPSDDVARGSNLVSGEPLPKAPPEPERRSLRREERFSLQTNGARQLTLIQDFYTQGAFTGSMRWQLQRR
jgi:hypothetical protein